MASLEDETQQRAATLQIYMLLIENQTGHYSSDNALPTSAIVDLLIWDESDLRDHIAYLVEEKHIPIDCPENQGRGLYINDSDKAERHIQKLESKQKSSW